MQVIASSTTDSGSYSWTVPTSLSDGSYYKIKISDSSDSSLYDFSDSGFTITTVDTPLITVIFPNGGETWEVGSTHSLMWNSGSTSGYVDIELYDSSSSVKVIASSTTDDGSYTWTIPTSLSGGSSYKIKISDSRNSSLYDFSDSVFTITTHPTPTITVISPNGGEIWEVGTTYNITWDSQSTSGHVNIELYKYGSYVVTIVSEMSDDGAYSWTVPTGMDDGGYSIKIVDSRNSTVFDSSDSYFTLKHSAISTPPVALSLTGIVFPTWHWIILKILIILLLTGIVTSMLNSSSASGAPPPSQNFGPPPPP